jgi:hypothetical protein
MRGRRRTLAAALGDALAGRREAQPAALAAALAEALGPRLAREVSVRGLTREGHVMVVVRSAAWAPQIAALASTLCAQVNARLGREVALAIDVHLASEP